MVHVVEKAGKVDYILYFNRGRFYQAYKEKLNQNAEIVYENNAGGVLKYNREEQ